MDCVVIFIQWEILFFIGIYLPILLSNFTQACTLEETLQLRLMAWMHYRKQ